MKVVSEEFLHPPNSSGLVWKMIQTSAARLETTRGLFAGEMKYDTYFTLFCSLVCVTRTCASDISVQSLRPSLPTIQVVISACFD